MKVKKGEINMDKQIEQLEKNIEFLESLLEINFKALAQSLETNRQLMNFIEANYLS